MNPEQTPPENKDMNQESVQSEVPVIEPAPMEEPVATEPAQSEAPVVAPVVPAAPVAPQPVAQPAAVAPVADDPGKTMGIVGFVLSLLGFGLVSLILGIIALKKSKAAGHSNGLALAAIIISAIGILFWIPFFFLVVLASYAEVQEAAMESAGLIPLALF